MSKAGVDINKNVNNKVDELYKTWLGRRDSNPRSWDQNPVPYRLATPQSTRSIVANRGADRQG